MSELDNALKIIEHYKCLAERHHADSVRYQAMLFHSWAALRQQQKGLRRLSRRVKRLQSGKRTLLEEI